MQNLIIVSMSCRGCKPLLRDYYLKKIPFELVENVISLWDCRSSNGPLIPSVEPERKYHMIITIFAYSNVIIEIERMIMKSSVI